MRKSWIFLSILVVVIACLMGSNVKAASDFDLNSIDFDAVLNQDGSMDVTETWNIEVNSLTNTLFKTFNIDKSKYSGISNVRVYEVNKDGTNNDFTETYQEVLHVDKNCYYALVNSSGKFEIAWGINERNGAKTYKINYKVEDCVKKYNDISELYWQFIGKDFEINIDKVTGTIHIPNEGNDIQSIRAWAHGPLNGDISIKSSDEVSFSLEYFDAGSYVEARLAMPNEAFPEITNVLNTDRLDTIITEETNLANEANRAREEMIAQREQDEKNEAIFNWALTILGVALSIIFLFKINKNDIELKANPVLKPEEPSKYYRDIPRNNATPAETAFLYYFNSNKLEGNYAKVLSATILDLALKEFVTFERVQTNNKKEQIIVKVARRDNSELKEDEKEIHELLKRIQGENNGFNMKEMEKYAKKHYEIFLGKLDKLPEIVKKQAQFEDIYSKNIEMKGNSWGIKAFLYMLSLAFGIFLFAMPISIAIPLILILTSGTCLVQSVIMASRLNGLIQKGVNEKEALNGLKRYMEDYSMIDDREVPELVIWERYLVYATVFGIADKVLKQLKVQYPELADGTYTNGA